MKLRHALGMLVLALGVGTAVPPAHAQYPPSVGAGQVTRSEMKQCQCTLFSGDGFAPGSTVTVYDKGPTGGQRRVGTTTADADGSFRFRVCLDENDEEGAHTLTAKGTAPGGGKREVHANVVVRDSVCYRKGDEVHGPNVVPPDTGGEDRGGDGDGSGGNGAVGGDKGTRGGGLPRTGADYVLPGLLLGFTLVVTGTGIVHLTRRRRLVTG